MFAFLSVYLFHYYRVAVVNDNGKKAPPPPSVIDVLIVGAGAAGIGAAKTLLAVSTPGAEVSVTILEASSRWGGRVRRASLTTNLNLVESDCGRNNDGGSSCGGAEDFIPIQLGANWLHGLDSEENRLYKLAVDMNLNLQVTSSDDEPGEDVMLFDIDNDTDSTDTSTDIHNNRKKNVIEFSKLKPVLGRYQWVRHQISNLECGDDLEQKSTTTKNNHGRLKKLSFQESFDHFVKKSEVHFGPFTDFESRCFNWFLDRMAIDYACSICKLSLFSDLEGESDGARGEAVVSEGIDTILATIVEKNSLSDKILMNHIVSDIAFIQSDEVDVNKKKKKIQISCENGKMFIADYCIVALPLGVLKSGRVSIPSHQIPQDVRYKIENLSCGLMNIVWLLFPRVFWPLGYNFFGHTRLVSEPCEFTTFLVPEIFDKHGNRQAVLMAQTVGDFALELEQMIDRDIAARATSVLRRMFGDDSGDDDGCLNVPDAIGVAHSSWASDPFTLGSWSYWDWNHHVSANGQDYSRSQNNQQRQPDDLLLFAGEYLNEEHRGTVHGAYSTGIDAAEKILSRRRSS